MQDTDDCQCVSMVNGEDFHGRFQEKDDINVVTMETIFHQEMYLPLISYQRQPRKGPGGAGEGGCVDGGYNVEKTRDIVMWTIMLPMKCSRRIVFSSIKFLHFLPNKREVATGFQVFHFFSNYDYEVNL